MSEWEVTILVALIGLVGSSGLVSGVFSVINTVLSQKVIKGDKTKELEGQIAEIKKAVEENRQTAEDNKKDAVRTQMLLLMSDYPEDKQEILKLAEVYFKDLGGNFYMDSIFCKWMKKNNIDKPSWFKRGN